MQEIEFMKSGSLTSEELDALVSVLQIAGQQKTLELRPKGDVASAPSMDKTVSSLEAMGVKIFGLAEPGVDHSKQAISWDNIAGYNQQKRYNNVTRLPTFSCHKSGCRPL